VRLKIRILAISDFSSHALRETLPRIVIRSDPRAGLMAVRANAAVVCGGCGSGEGGGALPCDREAVRRPFCDALAMFISNVRLGAEGMRARSKVGVWVQYRGDGCTE